MTSRESFHLQKHCSRIGDKSPRDELRAHIGESVPLTVRALGARDELPQPLPCLSSPLQPDGGTYKFGLEKEKAVVSPERLQTKLEGGLRP